MLQETYFTPELGKVIDHELQGQFKCICSWGTKHSKGVAFIMKECEEMTVIDKHVDDDGRLILMNVNVKDIIYTFVCIYAPNKENERNNFF